MNKRLLLLSVFLSAYAMVLSAASYPFSDVYYSKDSSGNYSYVPQDMYREMQIGGYVGTTGTLTISLIDSGISENSEYIEDYPPEGVPFDLEGEDLDPNGINPNGRVIGTWSLFSNTEKVVLKVKTSNLENDYQSSAGLETASIPYSLRFSYQYAVYGPDGKESGKKNGSFTVKSGSQDFMVIENVGVDTAQQIEIGAGDGQIRIQIEPGDVEGKPGGNYKSTITMVMESVQ